MNANFKPCSVGDCSGNADRSARGRRGWCSKHYQRWLNHGDPLVCLPRHPLYGSLMPWIMDRVSYDGNDCLIWPFQRDRDGYGKIKFGGRTANASRIMCEAAHGPGPTPKHEAAHSCGQGKQGCVNPKHLSWKTHAENMADTVTHGTSLAGERHPSARLTAAQVLEIRESYSGRRGELNALAERFMVSTGAIDGIVRGRTWASLNG